VVRAGANLLENYTLLALLPFPASSSGILVFLLGSVGVNQYKTACSRAVVCLHFRVDCYMMFATVY